MPETQNRAAIPERRALERETSLSVTEAKTPALREAAGKPSALRRFLPLILLLGLAAAAWSLGLKDYLTFEALRENRALLLSFVQDQAVLAVVVFTLAYAVSTAVSLPGGAFLTVIGVLISDLALAMLDPRIRLQGGATR